MGEYLLSVVVMSVFVGVTDCFSYPCGTEKTVKTAAALLLVYTATAPVLSLVGSIRDIGNNFDDFFEIELDTEGDYLQVSEGAFCQGILQLVSEKFNIPQEDIKVAVFGFDFEKMRAEKIKITLRKEAFFADWRGVQTYISELGLGDCEVNVSFG